MVAGYIENSCKLYKVGDLESWKNGKMENWTFDRRFELFQFSNTPLFQYINIFKDIFI